MAQGALGSPLLLSDYQTKIPLRPLPGGFSRAIRQPWVLKGTTTDLNGAREGATAQLTGTGFGQQLIREAGVGEASCCELAR